MAGINKTWDEVHADSEAQIYFDQAVPSAFAHEVESHVPKLSTIIELGCGTAKDSLFFAEHGHKTIATDVSKHAIARASQYLKHKNLDFQTVDISKPLPFEDGTVAVIYSRLALHYFTDEITKKIFAEINRILNDDGFLCFLCKSLEDPLCGVGKEIEKNVFMQEGKIRHFFSETYVSELLKNKYKIDILEKGKEKFYSYDSSYIKVIARKI